MNKLAAFLFVCAPLVATADDSQPAPRHVPASVVAASQVAHPAPRLPRDWIAGHPGVEQVQGVYEVCLGDDGSVATVTPMRKIEGADGAIALQIAENWRYQASLAGACFASLVQFKIEEPAIRMLPPRGQMKPSPGRVSTRFH